MARPSAIPLLTGAFLWATLLPAQQPDQTTGILKGRVVNANSGEPIRKAQVRLAPVVISAAAITGAGGANSVTVADDGTFLLTSVSAGQYRLTAQATKFVQQGYGAPPGIFQGTTFEVSAGQTIDNLEIRMLPQGVIAGRVTDEDGDPVQRAEVTLWRFEYPDGDRQLVRQPFGNPGTNDLGEYRFYGLPPGRYIVSATAQLANRGGGKEHSEVDTIVVDTIATYYPRSADPGGAAVVEVAAGGNALGIDIRMLTSRLVSIRGSISGIPAAPAPDLSGRGSAGRGGARGGRGGAQASVNLMSLDSAALARSGIVNPDGSFVISQVGPGSYTIQAWGIGTPQQPMLASAPLEVAGRDIEGISLRLLPPIKLSAGVTVEPPGTPVPPFNTLRLSFRALLRNSAVTAAPQADGTFLAPQLWNDQYRLELSGIPDGYYLKAVRLSGQEAPEATLDFRSGGPADGRVELVLAATSAVVAGTVSNSKGAPAVNVKVTVVPASGSSRRDLYPSQNTDGNGNFAFKSLAPGKYRVYAWDQMDGNAWINQEFRKPYESSAAAAEISDSVSANVSVNLIEGVR